MPTTFSHINRKTDFILRPEIYHSFIVKKMEKIKEEYRILKEKRKKKSEPEKPVSIWTEKDVYNGEVVDALVVIFRTSGCRWHKKRGCSMCGYFVDTAHVTKEDLLKQIDYASKQHTSQPVVKVFTSGSFFDEEEFPTEARSHLLTTFKKARKFIFETRPEFVKKKTLESFKDIGKEIEIAVGLESSNDHILKYVINKGFRFSDYIKVAKIIKEEGFKLKTYLLLKPPFLTEFEAIEDTLKSIYDIVPYADTISINPINVQNFSFVAYLWRERLYRAPWFWSLLEVLKKAHETTEKENVRLLSSPTGAGTERGIHNCRKCDPYIKKAVERYSLNGSFSSLQVPECRCIDKWKDEIEFSSFYMSEVFFES